MATLSSSADADFDSVDLIWLDASVNQSKENLEIQQQLRAIVHHLQVFEHVHDCEQFIRQTLKTDRFFLIVSGQLGQEIVPRIHHHRQILSIYVFCLNKKLNEEWSKYFPKIRSVLVQQDQLLNQIRLDQLKRLENKIEEPLLIHISQINHLNDRSTNELNGEFLHSQLLLDCLLRMKSDPTDRQELINFCRKIYKNNPNELHFIKEFEANYSPTQALWWYTRDSFFYRLLNKALRIQNIELLYFFRFFLRDMENQLKQYQCSTSIRVYRGQLMSMEELNQLTKSPGEYISINSFFSTSLNRHKALSFLNDESFANDLHKVLFEIDANVSADHQKWFADISAISYYSYEEEILFMLGSIFRLINIKQEQNGLWIIQMVLSNHHDGKMKILFENIKSQSNSQTNLLSFANVLHQMGKYDLAEKYFHRLLADLPNDHEDLFRCYHALGVIAFIKDNYDLSLQWHEKSLKAFRLNHSQLATSYNCIGCIHQKRGDLPKALEFYGKAWDIWKADSEADSYQIADCLNNMGCVYETEKNYSKALECHQQALAIRKKCLPTDHPDLGGSYNNIGNIYLCLEEYDLALENYKHAYEIKLNSLPAQHASLALTLENLGLVYEQKGALEQALVYYEKAANIFREIFSSTHVQVRDIEQTIQRISDALNSVKISTRF